MGGAEKEMNVGWARLWAGLMAQGGGRTNGGGGDIKWS